VEADVYAEKVIHALLMQDAGVTALAGQRCYPGELPQGCAHPALTYEHVVSTELPTYAAPGDGALMRARIQVTCIADTYPAVKRLLAAVVAACNKARGLIADVQVISVVRDVVGPDDKGDDRGVRLQPVDFIVIYQEP
jgi:hypothetical protein